MVPEFFDFFALAEEKERMERKKEEKEKKSVHGDQNPQETTTIVPVPVPVTGSEFFTNECRRPRTNRRILGTMRMTEEGPSYHMIGDSADVVVAGDPLSSRQEVAVINDVRKKRIVQTQKPLDLDLQGPSYHLIGDSANVVVAGDPLSSRQEVPVINDAHRKPRAKRIVQTEKSLDLDLNQPPPAAEKEREKKSGIRKRKGENPGGKNKTQKKRATEGSSDGGPNPPPELPQEVIDQIRLRAQAAGRADVDDGGVILVVQKELTKSDLEKSQNRLIFTKNQLRTENFLNEREKTHIKKENGHCLSLAVPIIEPSNKVPEVKFTQWTRGTNKSESFVINGSWVKIISSKENPPKLGQIVQLWAFRLNGVLNFALVFLPMEAQNNNTSAGADESSEVTRLTSMASTSEASPEETEDANNRTAVAEAAVPPAEAAVPITGDGDDNTVATCKRKRD